MAAPELMASLVEQAPDAIIFSDPQGLIQVWNPAASRIFGFSQQEALGQSLDIIIPERFRKAHWRGFERALADRETRYAGQALTTRSLRSDGSTIYVDLSFSIVTGPDGVALGALSHARDVTERFEKERADRKRLQELEGAAAER